MNKLILVGIYTQQKYDADGEWDGAEIIICCDIEGESNLPRVDVRIGLSPKYIEATEDFGYNPVTEDFLMKRVEAGLATIRKKWTGLDKDANTIYEVARLKMPRFIAKACAGVSYIWNAQTGEIMESQN